MHPRGAAYLGGDAQGASLSSCRQLRKVREVVPAIRIDSPLRRDVNGAHVMGIRNVTFAISVDLLLPNTNAWRIPKATQGTVDAISEAPLSQALFN